MARFTLPRDLYHGKGALEVLKTLSGKRAMVCVGGSSPIDATKAMWIKYEYPEVTFEDMCKVFGLPKLRQKAHFCAISSTSGTATEVTAFSVITDYEKGIKYPLADFEITPDIAILDACTGSNPRQPNQEEMEKLFKCCYYDLPVDF